jgi:hypothetical protein
MSEVEHKVNMLKKIIEYEKNIQNNKISNQMLKIEPEIKLK